MVDSIAILLGEGDQASPHVERAIERAAEEGATLHGVYVIDAWRFGEYSVYGWEELAREIETEKSEAVLEEVRDRCGARGVDFESTVTEGRPEEAVRSFVAAHDVGCIVCRSPDGSGRRTQSPKMLDRLGEESGANVEVV